MTPSEHDPSNRGKVGCPLWVHSLTRPLLRCRPPRWLAQELTCDARHEPHHCKAHEPSYHWERPLRFDFSAIARGPSNSSSASTSMLSRTSLRNSFSARGCLALPSDGSSFPALGSECCGGRLRFMLHLSARTAWSGRLFHGAGRRRAAATRTCHRRSEAQQDGEKDRRRHCGR
jgi:hypothetical protein